MKNEKLVWPTIEEQQAYWERKEEMERQEATCEWFDSLRDDGRNYDGSGESYAERNV